METNQFVLIVCAFFLTASAIAATLPSSEALTAKGEEFSVSKHGSVSFSESVLGVSLDAEFEASAGVRFVPELRAGGLGYGPIAKIEGEGHQEIANGNTIYIDFDIWSEPYYSIKIRGSISQNGKEWTFEWSKTGTGREIEVRIPVAEGINLIATLNLTSDAQLTGKTRITGSVMEPPASQIGHYKVVSGSLSGFFVGGDSIVIKKTDLDVKVNELSLGFNSLSLDIMGIGEYELISMPEGQIKYPIIQDMDTQPEIPTETSIEIKTDPHPWSIPILIFGMILLIGFIASLAVGKWAGFFRASFIAFLIVVFADILILSNVVNWYMLLFLEVVAVPIIAGFVSGFFIDSVYGPGFGSLMAALPFFIFTVFSISLVDSLAKIGPLGALLSIPAFIILLLLGVVGIILIGGTGASISIILRERTRKKVS